MTEVFNNNWRVPESTGGFKIQWRENYFYWRAFKFLPKNKIPPEGFLAYWSTNCSYRGAFEFESKLIILPEGFLSHWRD